MGAARKLEERMTVEERVTNIEKDVGHILTTLTDMKGEAKGLKAEVHQLGTEFHSFKTEVAKEFGLVRAEMEKGFGSLRTEMEKEVGSLRTEIERAKLWFVSTIAGTVATFIATLATVLHILGKI